MQNAPQLATTNAQLACLPKFSNDPKEDKSSTTEWLQKLMNKKQGAGWTGVQTVTHFKNALHLMNEKIQFEHDCRASPTISSVMS
jgi:hypothetical protein